MHCFYYVTGRLSEYAVSQRTDEKWCETEKLRYTIHTSIIFYFIINHATFGLVFLNSLVFYVFFLPDRLLLLIMDLRLFTQASTTEIARVSPGIVSTKNL